MERVTRKTTSRRKVRVERPFFYPKDRVYNWEYGHGSVIEWDNEKWEVLVNFDEWGIHAVYVVNCVSESEYLEVLEFISNRERKLWQRKEQLGM